MTVPMLEARGIRKIYPTGDGNLEVLKGVDLDLDRGEIVAVTGPSGVGKSTLLHILGLLDRPEGGRLTFDGVDVLDMGPDEASVFRNRKIGFIFQFHHLLNEFTALENVILPLMIARVDQKAALERGQSMLGRIGLADREKHLPGELSGGEMQRVAVARAIITEPDIVLADEPSGNLDRANKHELHDLIGKLARDMGQAFVIVTHDIDVARRADREVRLSDGKVAGIRIKDGSHGTGSSFSVENGSTPK